MNEQEAGGAARFSKWEIAWILLLCAVLLGGIGAWCLQERRRSAEPMRVERALREEAEYRIDLNSAPAAELMLLPGIGEVKAGLIIEYREKTGGLKDLKELKQIKGFDDKLINAIAEYVKLGPPAR